MTTHLPIGTVMLDIEGFTLTPHEHHKMSHPNTGGVILFSRNYQNPQQVAALIDSIRAARNGPVLIATDQEGGRVQRFKAGLTRLPPAASYAKKPKLAESAGWLMATELLALGVDFSFAPVLDVDWGISQVIGNRAFSDDPQVVARLASLFRKGMRTAGMAATGKHFPGHGGVTGDSHTTLPEDNRSLDSLRTRDFIPFARLIKDGLEAIMPGHVVYPRIDSDPAAFSAVWLQQILRDELQFTGAVFSDDLSMAGAATMGKLPERALLAQHAGCDMLVICNDPAGAEQVLNTLPTTNNPERERRLVRMLGNQALGVANRDSEKWEKIAHLLSAMH